VAGLLGRAVVRIFAFAILPVGKDLGFRMCANQYFIDMPQKTQSRPAYRFNNCKLSLT